MMGHWDHGWGVGQWLVMGFGMLLFWGLLVAAIVWIIRAAAVRNERTGQGAPPVDPLGSPRVTAQEILDGRYARGEIGDEEYRTRRDTLASRRAPG